jgi:two-component system NtrC family sensor kinase
MKSPTLANVPSRPSLKTYQLFAMLIVLMYGLDVVVLGKPSLAPLVVRGTWAALLMVLAEWLWRLPDGWRPLLAPLHGVLTTLMFLAIIQVTGGSTSPYFYLMPTLPLLVALIYPHSATPAICSGVLSAVGMMVLVLLDGQPPARALVWAAMVGAATFFGAYGSEQFRKAQVAEHEVRLERERREALEKLARTERHRTQSEKLATVGRLAASVAHEINNPLAFVRSNLEFLQREVASWPASEDSRKEADEILEETRAGLERIRQIVSDLRGFSRMDTEEAAECVLADVVTDAARLASLRLKHVAKLRLDVPRELPEVQATQRRLAQVILNLLVNAGDALEEARVQGGEVWVRASTEGDSVVLRVEDNGPGFSPEVLSRLFEAFFTTKGPEKGTGLGLAISRELVERFGGTLTAENRAEGGARLLLRLPAHTPGQEAPNTGALHFFPSHDGPHREEGA